MNIGKRIVINTYIINLDRATERWNKMMLQLVPFPEFCVHHIAGVEYEHSSQVEINAAASVHYFGQPLSAGTIGCYLGHVHAWDALYRSKQSYGLILEDDAAFDPRLLRSILEQLGAFGTGSDKDSRFKNWDICSFQLNHRGMPLPLKRLEKGYRLCTYLASVTGAGAYVVTQRGVNALLSKAFPVVLPVDHYYTKSHRLKVRFVGIEPRIVHQRPGPSFIEEIGRERLSTLSTWARVRCATFRVKEEILQAFYNLRWASSVYRDYTLFR